MTDIRCITVLATLLINLATCDNPRIRRHLTKNGFHRDLVTHVEWDMKPFHGARLEDCHLLMRETLPAGVYVDPYQLNSLLPFGGPQVLIDKSVDIEAPEYLSSPLTLHLFTRLHPENRARRRHTANISLPIHLRYHRPSSVAGQEYHTLRINNPVVFTNCSVQDSEGLSITACDFSNSSVCWWHQHPTQSGSSFLQIAVPIGQQSHLTMVVMGTLLVTAAGCLFIMFAVINKDLSTKETRI